jgi:hypothetical protein
VIVWFVFVATVFLLVFIHAVRTGRIRARGETFDTYRAAAPSMFWLRASPALILAGMLLYYAVRLILDLAGLVPW